MPGDNKINCVHLLRSSIVFSLCCIACHQENTAFQVLCGYSTDDTTAIQVIADVTTDVAKAVFIALTNVSISGEESLGQHATQKKASAIEVTTTVLNLMKDSNTPALIANTAATYEMASVSIVCLKQKRTVI